MFVRSHAVRVVSPGSLPACRFPRFTTGPSVCDRIFCRPRIVDIDNRNTVRSKLLEQFGFGSVIIFNVTVKIEVIAAKIREAGHVERNARYPSQRQRMARNFHRRVSATVGTHPRQPLCNARRRGRRQRSRLDRQSVKIAERSQHARTDARRVEHSGDQIARRRLSVGSC